MRLGRKKQKASEQPVQRFRRQGTPIVDTRRLVPDDDLRHRSADSGDVRPYQEAQIDVNGKVVPDATVNRAGS
jgi:hypothetical protein